MYQCSLLRGLQRCSILSRASIRQQGRISIRIGQARSFTIGKWLRQDENKSLPNELLESYKNSLIFPKATHQLPIRDLRYSADHSGKTVTLHGYLGHLRTPSKNLAFIEFFGPELDQSIQLVSLKASIGNEKHELIRHSRLWMPVVITGEVKSKSAPTANETHSGQIPHEIQLFDVQILNKFPSDIDPSFNFGPEQRHLQLKASRDLRKALEFRSKVYQAALTTLTEKEYQHVETPLLFKSTSEGAREFLVPTRRDGLAYALPQSPQQYKQLLIASGIPKYFQMARCFRDEDMRADRQPEFTQLDLERAFASGEDIMADVELLVKKILSSVPIPYGNNETQISYDTPFNVYTYQEVMTRYGTDKPDLRLGYNIEKINHVLPVDLVSKISSLAFPAVDMTVFRAQSGFDQDPSKMRAFINNFLDSPEALPYHNNPDGGPGIFIYDTMKPLSGLQAFGFEAAEEVERLFEPEEGDLIILQARPDEPFHGGSTALGRLMVDLNRSAVTQKLKTLPPGLEFLWVVDFPLFSPNSADEVGQSGQAGLRSTHHPFTSPKTPADVDLLLTDPAAVTADHYDLVVNGVEVGGGSRRIHNADVQRLVMEQVLKMPAEKVGEFDHLLEALRAGCPPHAGFALGLDRFIATLLGKESVRDVIAFPKWGRGDDPMVKSPAKASDEEWSVYKLKSRT